MKKSFVFLAIAGCLVVGVQGAQAQDSAVDMVAKACEMEIENYCSQVMPGEQRMLACFFAHEDKLSGQCGYALYQVAAGLEEFATNVTYVASACQADLTEHCGDVAMGEGRVASCLMEHKGDVSDGCAPAIDETGLEVVE